MKGLAAWRVDPRVQRVEATWVGRLVLALAQGNLRDRALSIAGQAFTALVPFLIVLATLASSSDSAAVADWLIDRFSLTGDSADAVRQLFARPPDATDSTSVIGVLILLVSVASFARSVQRTYETAWDVPAKARGRTLFGLAGALLMGSTLGLTALIATMFQDLTAGRLATLVGQLALGLPAWWLVSWLLLSRRIGWRLLLPGAAVSASAQALTSWAGSIYIPHLLESNTRQYGVIGVALAIISWLVVLAFLVVTSAMVGAHAGSRLADRSPATASTAQRPSRSGGAPPRPSSRT